MIRILAFLILFGIFACGTWYLSTRESYKLQSIRLLQAGKPGLALQVLKTWKKLEPRADLVHQLLGRAYLERYLEAGAKTDLNQAENAFKQADHLYSRDPQLQYSWAQLSKIKAGVEISKKAYKDYALHMHKACELDPKNYYYYSIYFETLISFLTDMQYLRAPLEKETYLNEISFALRGYLSLKDYYRDRYLRLVKAHFSVSEQERILGGAN